VLGQIKSGIGFDRFLYRGKPKVASEWNVACAALNLRKMAAAITRKPKKMDGEPTLSQFERVFERCIAYALHCFRLPVGYFMRQSASIAASA
jgi:hypothetical protein